MQMVPRTYVTRSIEDTDRADHARRLARAEERGDLEELEIIKESFSRWEQEQGSKYERLACPVCRDGFLVPTASGTSRPHARRDWTQPSWDRVRRLRKDIEALQAELDRVLQSLESASAPDE